MIKLTKTTGHRRLRVHAGALRQAVDIMIADDGGIDGRGIIYIARDGCYLYPPPGGWYATLNLRHYAGDAHIRDLGADWVVRDWLDDHCDPDPRGRGMWILRDNDD